MVLPYPNKRITSGRGYKRLVQEKNIHIFMVLSCLVMGGGVKRDSGFNNILE